MIVFLQYLINTETFFTDSKVYVKGRINYREDEDPKIIIEELSPLEKNDQGVLVISVSDWDKVNLEAIKDFTSTHPGNCQVVIHLNEQNRSFLLDKKIEGSSNTLNLFTEQTGLRNYLFWDKLIM